MSEIHPGSDSGGPAVPQSKVGAAAGKAGWWLAAKALGFIEFCLASVALVTAGLSMDTGQNTVAVAGLGLAIIAIEMIKLRLGIGRNRGSDGALNTRHTLVVATLCVVGLVLLANGPSTRMPAFVLYGIALLYGCIIRFNVHLIFSPAHQDLALVRTRLIRAAGGGVVASIVVLALGVQGGELSLAMSVVMALASSVGATGWFLGLQALAPLSARMAANLPDFATAEEYKRESDFLYSSNTLGRSPAPAIGGGVMGKNSNAFWAWTGYFFATSLAAAIVGQGLLFFYPYLLATKRPERPQV